MILEETHEYGKIDDDVQVVTFVDSYGDYLYDKYFNKFKNVLFFNINSVKLEKIDKHSFNGAKNLERFYGYNNFFTKLYAKII